MSLRLWFLQLFLDSPYPNSYGCSCCLTSQFPFSLPGKTVARQRASNNSQLANVCL
jgi:hypothetical protein